MAGVVRGILARKKFVFSSKGSFSLHTKPSEYVGRLEKNDWEFSERMCCPSNRRRLKKYGIKLYDSSGITDVSIKHLNSGIRFHFCAYDAVSKWLEENETRHPLVSNFPSYASPLLPVPTYVKHYDCAYVGRILVAKPGEEPQNINPQWDDVDSETLRQQIAWSTLHEQVATALRPFVYKKQKKPRWNGLPELLLNHRVRLYTEACFPNGSTCYLYMAVTECGWFTYLRQNSQFYGSTRIREMTMHCPFDQNIIYREIVDRQSKEFENKLDRDKKKILLKDDEMYVHFHEVKKLRIPESCMPAGSKLSHTGRDAKKYSSSTFGEVMKTQPPMQSNVSHVRNYLSKATPLIESPTPLVSLDVPDSTIKSLLANCGKPSQHLEEIGTCVKVIPLFRYPYNPHINASTVDRLELPNQIPRKAYVPLMDMKNLQC